LIKHIQPETIIANGSEGTTGQVLSYNGTTIEWISPPYGPTGTNGTNGATGANGTNGTNGATGATGATGTSESLILGTTYLEPGSLLTTNLATTSTLVYQIGPVTALSTTQLLIMANTVVQAQNGTTIQLTVGRATVSGATAGQCINLASGLTGITLSETVPGTAIAGWPGPGGGVNNKIVNVNGFALDKPGAGTFYYNLWMASNVAHNFSTMTAAIEVLKVTT
jgi:hypothetical protein